MCTLKYCQHKVGGGGSPIHFHCVLHAKGVGWVKIACKIAYVLNGRPLTDSSSILVIVEDLKN